MGGVPAVDLCLFDLEGRYLGRTVGALDLPTAAVPGGRRELYAVDSGRGHIVRFEPDRE